MLEEYENAGKTLTKIWDWLVGIGRGGLTTRITAVDAIVAACIATQELIQALERGTDTADNGINAYKVSELWSSAAKLIAGINTDMYQEFLLKAYGWRTGQWDSQAFRESPVPRKVDEILAEALRIVANYQDNERIIRI